MARRKSRAVPYYLAVETAPVSRERLQAFFWPDHERTAAQQLLRTVLHGLRKNLNADLLVGEDALAIGAEVEVDVREFQAALSNRSTGKAGLDQALALYRGDLLADFSLPDSFEFEDWVAVEREHYRRSFLSGLGRLAEYYEAEREHGLAREVVLETEYLGTSRSPFGGTESAGFTAQTKINRKDWDLNWNVALETGGWLVDDQIAINIDVELIKQPEAELVAVAA